jgi:predicted amidophosphoribosyltransferase
MVRERHGPRLCETCQAEMTPEDETCWRCGGGETPAAPRPDDGSSLRERTTHVLDMRAHRSAARGDRDRHSRARG